jgi:hypothetical protein
MAHRCWCGRLFLSRIELPQRRGGTNFEFTHSGMRFVASVRATRVGEKVTEIFLNSEKIDSFADLLSRDAACAISIALQYGVPLSALAHSMGRNADGTACSPIGELLDIMMREEGNGA